MTLEDLFGKWGKHESVSVKAVHVNGHAPFAATMMQRMVSAVVLAGVLAGASGQALAASADAYHPQAPTAISSVDHNVDYHLKNADHSARFHMGNDGSLPAIHAKTVSVDNTARLIHDNPLPSLQDAVSHHGGSVIFTIQDGLKSEASFPSVADMANGDKECSIDIDSADVVTPGMTADQSMQFTILHEQAHCQSAFNATVSKVIDLLASQGQGALASSVSESYADASGLLHAAAKSPHDAEKIFAAIDADRAAPIVSQQVMDGMNNAPSHLVSNGHYYVLEKDSMYKTNFAIAKARDTWRQHGAELAKLYANDPVAASKMIDGYAGDAALKAADSLTRSFSPETAKDVFLAIHGQQNINSHLVTGDADVRPVSRNTFAIR